MSDGSRADDGVNPASAGLPGSAPGAASMREDVVGGALAPDAGDDADTSSTAGATDPVQGDAGTTATASAAPQATNPSSHTQDEPAMDGNVASVQDKINGIAAQTRIDVGTEGPERIAEVLRQRFVDTGIDVSDADRAALAERVASEA